MGNNFIKWCKDLGIAQQHTVKATPQQNVSAKDSIAR